VLKAAGLSAVLGTALWLGHGYPASAVPAIYAVGLALYGAAMVALGGVTPSELAKVKRLLGRGGAVELETGPRL